MITYSKATFDAPTVSQLIELSKIWVEEDSCFGMVANDESDLQEPCFIAKEGDRIVGYIFGHYYTKEKKTSNIEVGAACFDVDELYVLPAYRSQGIGRTLFAMMEEEIQGKVQYLTLVTCTKDYRKALHFYAETQGLTFHDAFLFKKY